MKRLDSRPFSPFLPEECADKKRRTLQHSQDQFRAIKIICKEATLKLLNILAQKSYKSGKAKTRYARSKSESSRCERREEAHQ